MRLEDLTVEARPRGIGELHDLSLLIMRRHPWQIVVTALLGIAPWAALNAWIVALIPNNAASWWLLLVLLYAQAQIATAWLSAFLGLAMFSPTPSMGEALRLALRSSGALLLWLPLRAVAALGAVLVLWMPAHSSHVHILERLGIRDGFRRAQELHRVDMSLHVVQVLIVVVVGVCAGWALDATVATVEGLLRRGNVLTALQADAGTLWPQWSAQVALWATTMYVAVVRFASYIDLRTRHEGWDVVIDLRRAGERLRPTP